MNECILITSEITVFWLFPLDHLKEPASTTPHHPTARFEADFCPPPPSRSGSTAPSGRRSTECVRKKRRRGGAANGPDPTKKPVSSHPVTGPGKRNKRRRSHEYSDIILCFFFVRVVFTLRELLNPMTQANQLKHHQESNPDNAELLLVYEAAAAVGTP